jgi:16S rRNA (guanine966-N2)-methyltransferase
MTEAGRVIAGSARGIRLLSPGEGTRPFADRVKQTVFAILEPDLPGARVLDLFAGSGAGGIEALSRGAASALFVERGSAAARVISENLARTRLAHAGRVIGADVTAYLAGRGSEDGPFDVVLVDPPFADTSIMLATLDRLGRPPAAMLAAGAWVVARYFWRDAPPDTFGLIASVRTRRFGETGVTFYRRAGGSPELANASAGADESASETEESAR